MKAIEEGGKRLRGGFSCLMVILCPRPTDGKDKTKKETEHSLLLLETKRVPSFRERVRGKNVVFLGNECVLKQIFILGFTPADRFVSYCYRKKIYVFFVELGFYGPLVRAILCSRQ